MTNAIFSVGLGTATTLGFLMGDALVLGNGTHITLGEAVASIVFVSGIVAWMSRKLQRLEDGQQRLAEGQKAIAAQVTNLQCVRQKICPDGSENPTIPED